MKFCRPNIQVCFRPLSFVLAAVLAAGMAAVPWAAAQATVPAENATHAARGEAGTPPPSPSNERGNSEEELINGLLHSGAVRGLARLLHLDLETTDAILLDVNYVIIFLAILIPLSRALPKIVRKRNLTLRSNLESARKLTDDATARLGAVEEQLARLGDEIDKFRQEVEAELKNDEARIKSTIETESAHIVAAAEQEINLAAVQARRGLRRFAAELAVEHASRQMALSPDTDRALIAEFAASVAHHENGSSGGQN